MKRTAQAASETKLLLLRTARDLFHRQGYPVTSVNDIVAEAGLTKGAFYHHFASKEVVLRDLHDDFVSDQLERVQAVADRALPADEALRQMVHEILISVADHREAIGVFLRDRRFLSDEVAEQINRKRDEFEALITATVERGIADGTFDAVSSARLLAFGIVGMCAWSHEWFDPHGPTSAEEIASMYADVLLRGLDRRDS